MRWNDTNTTGDREQETRLGISMLDMTGRTPHVKAGGDSHPGVLTWKLLHLQLLMQLQLNCTTASLHLHETGGPVVSEALMDRTTANSPSREAGQYCDQKFTVKSRDEFTAARNICPN